MILGERLCALREQKKLSQGDIEKKTGLLRCYVSRIENGHTVPSVETLEKFAHALEVPMYRLFHDREEPPELLNLLKRKSADDIVWGSEGKDAGMLSMYRRLFGQMKEDDRKLLFSSPRRWCRGRIFDDLLSPIYTLGSVTTLQESSLQSQPSCARAVQAQAGKTFRDYRPCLLVAAIPLSRKHPADRMFVPRSGRTSSKAKDKLPRPRSGWAVCSIRRTARNERGHWHAAGCSAATEYLRAWPSLPIPAYRNERPTWLALSVRLAAASVSCRIGLRHCRCYRPGQNQHRCPGPSANGAGNRQEMTATHGVICSVRSIEAGMKNRGLCQQWLVTPRRPSQPAILQSPDESNICVGWAAARLRARH